MTLPFFLNLRRNWKIVMAKKSKFWSGDKLIGLSAMFISICTLIVFLYQTNLIKKQQYASVFPYLELGHSGIFTKNYNLNLENKGIGPALITDVQLRYKNTILDKSLYEFVQSKISKSDSVSAHYSSIYAGRLISPNESIELIGVDAKDEESSGIIYEILNDSDLELIITYESIYEEKWQIKKGSTGTFKLN